MADYYQVRINVENSNETITDLLAAYLADCDYESFVPDEDGITAYINASLFNEECVNEILADFPMPIKATVKSEYIVGKDWNEEWEKNYFQPILIEDKCVIHSTFHKDVPKAKYDIVIDPKMAFGTGHHSTTSLILRYLLSLELQGKYVIDMGTGTGILAILAAMRGAIASGIEIDEGAYENALENVKLNGVDVKILLGDASRLTDVDIADLFIANINRNIILADMANYCKAMKSGSTMILSGFYESDIPMIEKVAQINNLKIIDYKTDNNWAAVRLSYE